jgi:protein-disulfide isomerase
MRRFLFRRLRPMAAALALIAALSAGAARADSPLPFTPAQRNAIIAIMRDALVRDPTILRDAIQAMQTAAAREAEAASRKAITAAGPSLVSPADPIEGNPRGDVTVVEFFDTRCPYCRKLNPTVAALLASDHGVRLVLKDLPILGPPSVVGSRALLAAMRQRDQIPDAYDRLRAAIMAPGMVETTEAIVLAAQRMGLDPNRLRQDMSDPAIQQQLDANVALAQSLHVDGTPGLVIGSRLIPGAVDLSELRQAVADARAEGHAAGQPAPRSGG